MLRRLYKLMRYNRDWPRYLYGRYGRGRRDEVTTFRLRNGQTITVPAAARFILNEIYLDRVYDVPGVDLARCRSVLDIGSNVGIFALYVASMAPQTCVHCFEPEPRNFEMLERNLERNDVRARTYRLALSTSCGTAHLQLTGSCAEYALGAAEAGSTSVQCIDWDQMLRLTGVDSIDFLKMDVEGHEREILAACTDAQLRRICALSLEWHHEMGELEALAERFRGIGFDARADVLHGHIRYLKARRLAG